MRTTLGALIASTALAAAGLAAPAGTAQAEVLADWTMELTVRDTSWSELLTTNFLGCADLPIRLTVKVPTTETAWKVTGEITGSDSTVVLETFAFAGVGSTTAWDGISVPGVKMCRHLEGPVTPPNHEYVVAANATVSSSPSPEQLLTERFVIGPMHSFAHGVFHEDRGGASAVGCVVEVSTQDGFKRLAPAALVTMERLEGATWLAVGTVMPSQDGSYTITADRLLPAGTYVRFLYAGTYWAASHVGMPWQLGMAWKPPPMIIAPPISPPAPVTVVQPIPTVKVKAVSSRSKLKVDVNPNVGRRYWTFQVQKKLPDGTWQALKTYRTLGASEKRTINLPKGIYHVWVNPKFGHQGVMSAEVTLKR